MAELKDPRVLYAAERTLLAWNRTGLSLVAFGFIIERSGLIMEALIPASAHPAQVPLTFWLGIAAILLGAFASAFSARQYLVVLRSVAARDLPPGHARWAGLAVSALVVTLGVCLVFLLLVAHFRVASSGPRAEATTPRVTEDGNGQLRGRRRPAPQIRSLPLAIRALPR